MQEHSFPITWRTLPNPFDIVREPNGPDVFTGHISGRKTDIGEIVGASQSAIILVGAPGIGKTSLLRYLQRPLEMSWSWRNELAGYIRPQVLHNTFFTQVNLEDIENINELPKMFVERCFTALQSLCQPQEQFSSDIKGLRELLRYAKRTKKTENARYFLIFDTIERIVRPGFTNANEEGIRMQQERALALLDKCGAIRILIDLVDEFYNFGAILSIQSLPRPEISEQLIYVSADLARFKTTTLQTFTWEETGKFLAQPAECFGETWADHFTSLGGSVVFSTEEQAWIREQAGTHPYLLQQFCRETFHLKQQFASDSESWTELSGRTKSQLGELMSERLNSFLSLTRQRLQEAVERSSPLTREQFLECLNLFKQYQSSKIIEPSFWDNWSLELRYILYSEGILRYDPSQSVHFPGVTLCKYLLQDAREHPRSLTGQPFLPVPIVTSQEREVQIVRPGHTLDTLYLSELEYHLLSMLLQKPENMTQEELMKETWGNRAAFSQRMHHLRKKLRDRCGIDIIINRYGGHYSLQHPEWLRLTY